MLVRRTVTAITAHWGKLKLDALVDIFDVGLVDGSIFEDHFLKAVMITIADLIAVHLHQAPMSACLSVKVDGFRSMVLATPQHPCAIQCTSHARHTPRSLYIESAHHAYSPPDEPTNESTSTHLTEPLDDGIALDTTRIRIVHPYRIDIFLPRIHLNFPVGQPGLRFIVVACNLSARAIGGRRSHGTSCRGSYRLPMLVALFHDRQPHL